MISSFRFLLGTSKEYHPCSHVSTIISKKYSDIVFLCAYCAQSGTVLK
nr:MAG TPA: hypothetical protein [Caudoviricetes sp.]